MKTGLYYNINQKRKRIAEGSGEKMRIDLSLMFT